jgi:hypothetical protein
MDARAHSQRIVPEGLHYPPIASRVMTEVDGCACRMFMVPFEPNLVHVTKVDGVQ